MARISIATALILGSLLAGCDEYPRDAKETLQQVREGQRPLRVGWAAAEPWVRMEPGPDGPRGLEPDLVRAWAASIGAQIQWESGSEAQLVRALQRNALDIGIAGFSDDTPWGSRTGQSQPYFRAELAVGATSGTPEPTDWNGVEIRYDRRRPDIRAAIRAIGAVPVPADPPNLAPLGAAYLQEMQALGLTPTGKRLGTERRVIATAPAESALTFALDRFLLPRSTEIEDRLSAEARR